MFVVSIKSEFQYNTVLQAPQMIIFPSWLGLPSIASAFVNQLP